MKNLGDLNFNIVVNTQTTLCYAKPNQTRRIVPDSRNKQRRNEFKAKKSNKDCPKFGSKMQLYNITAQIKRGIDLPKVVNKKHKTGG